MPQVDVGSCSFSSSLFLLLPGTLLAPGPGVAGAPCSVPRAIKGVEAKVPAGSAPDLKGSLCGAAVPWPFQEGQG